MENMKIYNAVSEVPANAQKPISGGRLNGMTDINPMWRIRVSYGTIRNSWDRLVL